MPPTPSAMSSESAPVGIASTRTAASSSPIRMIEPLPNWRSICESAPFRAASRALAAFSCSLSMSLLEVWNRNAKAETGQISSPLGLTRDKAGNAERAMSVDRSVIAALEQALEADPSSTPVRLHLADLLLEAGEPAKALEHSRTVLDADPAHLE